MHTLLQAPSDSDGPKDSIVNRDLLVFRPQELHPIIEQYYLLPRFEDRNKFAFQFANKIGADWWFRLALEASRVKATDKSFSCLVHLASAKFTKGASTANAVAMLESTNDDIVEGVLKLILFSRELNPNGLNDRWPEGRPYGKKVLSSNILKVAIEKPNLSSLAKEVLTSYGSGNEIIETKIASMLQSEDPKSQTEAIEILRSFASNLCRELGVSPSGEIQLPDYEKLRNYLSRNKLNKRQSLEYRSERLRSIPAIAFPLRHSEVIRLAETIDSDEDYLDFALLADASNKFEHIRHLASVLYLRTGGKKKIATVLRSTDRVAVRGVLRMLSRFYLFDVNKVYDSYPESGIFIGDRDFWPPAIANVLDLHPDLIIDVSRAISPYVGPAAEIAFKQKLAPLLLSDDPVVVTEIRMAFSDLAPETATRVGVYLSRPQGIFALSQDQPTCLTASQNRNVNDYLKSN